MAVHIQFQDTSGWRNVVSVPDTTSSQRILIEMRSVKNIYPRYRVRAADDDGRMIDILT